MIQIDEELVSMDGILCGAGAADLVFCAKPTELAALPRAHVARISTGHAR
jgi:prolyl-tRNA editing enzyme YbaK/EbsC (Cys-tRNA(Pro) deacylase)